MMLLGMVLFGGHSHGGHGHDEENSSGHSHGYVKLI